MSIVSYIVNDEIKVNYDKNVISTLVTKVNDNSLISGSDFYIGEVIGNVQPTNGIDIRKYKKVSVFIRNQHDKPVLVRLQKKVLNNYGSAGFNVSDYINIGPNEAYVFDEETFPLMKAPAPFLVGHIKKTSEDITAGVLSVYVFGEVK